MVSLSDSWIFPKVLDQLSDQFRSIYHMVIYQPEQVIHTVNPEERKSPTALMSGDVGRIAQTLIPWLRENPKFTLLAAAQYLGLPNNAEMDRVYFDRIVKAIYRLKCTIVGNLEDREGAKVYQFNNELQTIQNDVPVRITANGFSTNPDELMPMDDQVEVCRAWLRVCARPTSLLNKRISTYGLKHQVEGWTLETGLFKDQVQTEQDTGEQFTKARFYVTEGAFMVAAQKEKFQVIQEPESRNGWLNISVRKPGQPWRGRTPKVWANGEVKLRGRRNKEVKSEDIYDPQRVKRILLKFLNTRKYIFRTENAPPTFTLRQAAGLVRIKYVKGKPPQVLLNTLRDLGCVCMSRRFTPKKEKEEWTWKKEKSGVKEKSKTRRRVYWCRLADMPKDWQEIYRHSQYLKQKRKKGVKS
jgi:hypothetical protein